MAAFAVFLVHGQGLFATGIGAEVLHRLGRQGFTGVSFFYILSGFVLTWSHKPGDSPRAFYRRRFARIAPAYWVALCGGIGLTLYAERSRGLAPLWEAIPSIPALQAWFPVERIYFGGNGVGWSISCEAFFYFVFPALILLLPRMRGHRWAAASALSLLAILPSLLVRGSGESSALWATYVLPPSRVAEFALGMLIAASTRAGWRPPISYRCAAALSLVGYLALGWLPAWSAAAVMVVPFALLIASAARRDLDGYSTLMGRAWGRRLGEWSFAFYLVHELVLRTVIPLEHKVGTSLGVSAAATVVALLAALTAAGLLYHFVEAPFERRLRHARPRKEATEAPADPHAGIRPRG